MIGAARDVFTSPVMRAALPGLVADVVADTDLNSRVMQRFAGTFVTVRARIVDGIVRGEVQPDVDPDRLVELIGGSTMLRMLLWPERELDDEWVSQTAAILVHGATVKP